MREILVIDNSGRVRALLSVIFGKDLSSKKFLDFQKFWKKELDKSEEYQCSLIEITSELDDIDVFGEHLFESAWLGDIFLFFNSDEINKEVLDQIELLAEKNRNIFGLIDLKIPLQSHSATFRIIRDSYYGESRFMSGKNYELISKKLQETIANISKELHKVKEVHEKSVPRRVQTHKGITIESKFSPGTSSGGEFFDTVNTTNEILVLLTSSASYLISSIVLTCFSELFSKNEINLNVIDDFVKTIENGIKEMSLEDNRFNMLIGFIDLNKLKFVGYNFGSTQVISLEENIFLGNNLNVSSLFKDKAYLDIQLHRGEKLLVLSPGVIANCSGKLASLEAYKWVAEKNKSFSNILNELFIELGKNNPKKFLEYDSFGIKIEVSENVFIKV